MKIKVSLPVNASKEKIWSILTDIENAAQNISGIEKVEILNKPESGLVGLKWQETRTMFGKQATEIMWITEAEENSYYKTRAESHGAIYNSTISVGEEGGQSNVTMEFKGEPVSLGAKIMSAIMTPLFKGATKKMVVKDLEDIKAAAEKEA